MDIGLNGLDNKDECQSAMPAIQSVIPDATFSGDMDTTHRPVGCYYILNVFWNNNTLGGPCISCRSVCKG